MSSVTSLIQQRPLFRLTLYCATLVLALWLASWVKAQRLTEQAEQAATAPLFAGQPLPGGRIGHTTTLLPNGQVLVSGGFSNTATLDSCYLYNPANGNWSETGRLNNARGVHFAVLLASGKVLVGGGLNGEVPLKQTELYDPVTGKWENTGALEQARYSATATLLSSAANVPASLNGFVLLIGGRDTAGALKTAELYNPASGVWQKLSTTMNEARFWHTATLLSNGIVLVAGGSAGGNSSLGSAELYDPSVNQWIKLDPLLPRSNHTATLLPNGKVLAAGGLNNDTASNTAQLFDPVTRKWSATGNLRAARGAQSASLLPNGKLFLMGGLGAEHTALGTSELYDPATGVWAAGPTFTQGRASHTATLLAEGRVLLVAGSDLSTVLDSIELYDFAAGNWAAASANLNTKRRAHTATLLPNHKVLIAGGYTETGGATARTELYDLTSGTFSYTGDLLTARAEQTATLLPNGKVLVAGGAAGNPLNDGEVYDPATGAWTRTANLMANARVEHTATLMPSGKVLVCGGTTNRSSTNTSCDYYDPANNGWTSAGRLREGRRGYTATLLYDGRVLAAGGAPPPGTQQALLTSEVFDEATNTWTASGALNVPRFDHTATLLPNGRVLVVSGRRGASSSQPTNFSGSAELYNPSTLRWDSVSTPQGRADHTATLLSTGKVLLVGGFTVSASTGAALSIKDAELYDPARGVTTPFSTTAAPTLARDGHSATWLPNGKVLIVGGQIQQLDANPQFTDVAELFDAGLNVNNANAPSIAQIRDWNGPGNPLCVSGIRFQGVSEASSGGEQNSNSNYPVVQLRRLDNEQIYTLSPDANATACVGSKGWSNNSYASLSVPRTTLPGTTGNLHPGPALVTVFVNGIPSTQSVFVQPRPAEVNGGVTLANLIGRIYTVSDTGVATTVQLQDENGHVLKEVETGPNGEYIFEGLPTITPDAYITSISPSSIPAGSKDTPITVNGAGFRVSAGSARLNLVNFNGAQMTGATNTISSTQLTDVVPEALLSKPGLASLTVSVFKADGQIFLTQPVTLQITEAPPNPAPNLNSLTPNQATAGSSALTLSVTGSNFVNGAVVRWNGQSRSTSFVSSTQLNAQLSASDLTSAGTVPVTVFNPAPGGGASNALNFTVNPAPTNLSISNLNPASLTLPLGFYSSLPALNLTITGSGFNTGTLVRVNGVNQSANVVTLLSSTQLNLALQPQQYFAPGSLSISVLNPTNGQTSNSVTLPVAQGTRLPNTGGSGSLLLFPLYSSNSDQLASHNTRFYITNTASQAVTVRLFFIERTTGRADNRNFYYPMGGNQTISFTADNAVPDEAGYMIAFAASGRGECPLNFNFLQGEEEVILPTGHAATLPAIPVRASSTPTCSNFNTSAVLSFNGSAYEYLPSQIIADTVPSRAGGNDPLLVLNALGGDLRRDAGRVNALDSVSGSLYNAALNPYGFSQGNLSGSQLFASLSNNFPSTSPNFNTVIPTGQTGRLTINPSGSAASTTGLFGALLNRFSNTYTANTLRTLAYKQNIAYTIPIFPPVVSVRGAAPDTLLQVNRTLQPSAFALNKPPAVTLPDNSTANAPEPPRAQPTLASALQPTPGAPITYIVVPVDKANPNDPIIFVPRSRTITLTGNILNVVNAQGLRSANAPAQSTDTGFCAATKQSLGIAGLINFPASSAKQASVKAILTNNKRAECKLPTEFTTAVDAGDGSYLVKRWNNPDGNPLEQPELGLGIAGEYRIVPESALYTFQYNNPLEPASPYTGLGEFKTNPLNGLVVSVNFDTTIKNTCQPVTPTVAASGPVSFCEGGQVMLTASGDANATYRWYKDNVLTGLSTKTIAVSQTGSYTIEFTDANNCASNRSAVTLVTVNPFPAKPVLAADGPLALCQGQALTLTAPAGAASYQWFNGGTPLANTAATLSVNAAGSYTVAVTNNNGCLSSPSDPVVVTVTAPPSATITPAQAQVCGNAAGNSASVPDAGAGASYTWIVGNGTLTAGQGTRTITYTANASGTVALSVTVSSGACSTNGAASVPITPAPAITAQPANQTVCDNGQVSFSATASNAASVQWQVSTNGGNSFNDVANATSNQLNLTASAALNGNQYRALFTNSCSTVPSSAATLTVNALTAINTPPQSATVCAGAPVSFSVSASGTGLSYQWRKGGENIGGATSATYAVASAAEATAGSYDVVVTGTCGTVISSAAQLSLNSFTLSAASASFPATSSTGSVNVTATLGQCGWNASANNDWLSIVSVSSTSGTTTGAGAAGTGSGQVNFALAMNPGLSTRSGTLLIAGQTFTITQAGSLPAPRLDTLSQSTASVGAPGFTLILNGANFTNTAKVRWNESQRVTSFISATQLSAQLTAPDLALAGNFNLDIYDAPPGGGASNKLIFTVNNPAPQLTNLNPASREAGGGAFTLTINGTGFINGSQIKWDGADRATTFISGTQLQTQVASNELAAPGTINVSVLNPAPGGGLSNTLAFTIIQPNPLPTLSVISPSSATAGSGELALTIQGSGFVNGAVVRWNGSARPTTFVSATQLTATIPASDLNNPGTASLTIFNPPPGGGVSSATTFTINPAVSVTLSTLDPEQVIAGGEAFTLTVNGVNFNNSASLKIEGQARLTNYVNPTRLTAQLLAADVASAGNKRITVEIAGGVSNELLLRVIQQTASVSAASFKKSFAPEAILAGFGASLATTTQVANSVPLPTTLAGTTVRVRDSLGTSREAPLFFVSPTQVNYLLPAGTASGLARVTFTDGNGNVSGEEIQVTNTAPGLFSFASTGMGLPAALVFRATAGGAQTIEALNASGINLGPSSEQVFLILFGTGLRYRPDLLSVTATLGGTTLPVSFAGAQGSLVGLDQLNLGPLPESLRGRGELDLVLTVEGRAANTLKVRMQ